MVALASIYIGSSIGSMCSTINPFGVIIASDATGVNWTSRMAGRLIMFALGTLICILYIIRYAQRVKKNPSKSIIYSQREEIEHFFGNTTNSDIALTIRLRLIIFIFSMTFIIVVYGVSMLSWWFVEMTSVFLVGSILIGFIGKIKESVFVDTFVKGASDLLGVARGITVLMNDGLISDTMLMLVIRPMA